MTSVNEKQLITAGLVAFIASAAAGLLEIREHQSRILELERRVNERTEIVIEVVDRLARIEEALK